MSATEGALNTLADPRAEPPTTGRPMECFLCRKMIHRRASRRGISFEMLGLRHSPSAAPGRGQRSVRSDGGKYEFGPDLNYHEACAVGMDLWELKGRYDTAAVEILEKLASFSARA